MSNISRPNGRCVKAARGLDVQGLERSLNHSFELLKRAHYKEAVAEFNRVMEIFVALKRPSADSENPSPRVSRFTSHIALVPFAHGKDFSGVRRAPLQPVIAYGRLRRLEGAVNGLQVENRGTITRVAAAVDASLATAKLAVAAGPTDDCASRAVLESKSSWTGSAMNCCGCCWKTIWRIQLTLPSTRTALGNNAQLCAAIGLKKLKPFSLRSASSLVTSRARLKREELPGD